MSAPPGRAQPSPQNKCETCRVPHQIRELRSRATRLGTQQSAARNATSSIAVQRNSNTDERTWPAAKRHVSDQKTLPSEQSHRMPRMSHRRGRRRTPEAPFFDVAGWHVTCSWLERKMLARALTLGLVALAATSSLAVAQEPGALTEARSRVAAGEDAFGREDYDAALTEFERAYELVGEHPSRYLILYNIARSHERLFHYDEALNYYRRYLDEGGEQATDRDEVETVLRTLDGMLGTLNIHSNVDAAIWLDGRHIGEAPNSIRVAVGRHTVELRASGYLSAQQDVQLPARTTETLEFELEVVPEPSKGLSSLAFWLTGAAAVAVAAAGAGVGIQALRVRGQIDDRLADPVERFSVDDADRAQVTALARTADVLYATAGALGVTAVVLAILADWGDDDEDTAPVALLPSIGPSEFGITLRGQL